MAKERRFSDKYEIAEPASYAVFSPATLPPPEPEGVRAKEEGDAGKDRGPYYEAWDDTGKTAPRGEGRERFRSRDSTRTSGATPKEADARRDVRETRAIWVVHGMGQQIPFETVDSLAKGLLGAAEPIGVKPRLRTVKLGDQTMQRVELDVDGVEKDERGKAKRRYELHLYEAYWAPKTEGVARLRDVVSFLLDGALRGLLNSFHSFQRAMFGAMQPFRVPFRTPLWILLTLLVLLSLTVINGVILAAAAARTKLAVLAYKSLDYHWPQLTALASWMTAVAFTCGTILFLAELSKPHEMRPPIRRTVSTLVWVALAGTVGVIFFTSGVMGLTTRGVLAPNWLETMHRAQIQAVVTVVILACGLLVSVSMAWRARLRSSEKELRGDPGLVSFFVAAFLVHVAAVAIPFWLLLGHRLNVQLPPKFAFARSLLYSTVWVWPFLIALSAQIRTILVEYVGDVAIYVTPNKLDRFDDVRNKIKGLVRNVAQAIYLACKPGTNEFLYDEIAVVGHSLGSVIAYDTLNRLMLDDWLSRNCLGIANRTNSLVTFGSPLNKTAFFFTIQGTDTLHIRERLAATVQPLIQSYHKFRKFNWINVYSRNDIISGDLIFYDRPDEPAPPGVKNIVDKDACIPIVAHVDYWKNPTVWTELLRQIAP